MSIRTNLCTNSTFELDTSGWLAYDPNTAINRSTTAPRSGTAALGVQNNVSGRLTATYGTTNAGVPTSYSIAVTAGQSVTVSMYVRQGLGSLAVFPMIFWQTASAFGSSTSGSAVTVTSSYQRISLTAVAPAGTTKFGFGARVTTTASGDYFYLDDALAEISTTLDPYFDATMVSAGKTYTWSGASYASTSIEDTSTAGTYLLDWSSTSVGTTIDYTNANGRVALSSSIPASTSATNSLTWVPSLTPSDNVYFELPVTLSAAGNVSFFRRTSSETNFDYLRFYVDGVEQQKWSGETPWLQVTYALASGAHTLKWAFTHDGGGLAGSNTAWLALLQITNMSSVPAVRNSTKTAKLYDFEDGTIPSIISGTWTNSTSSPITGTHSMRTPATTAGSGVYDLTIDTSSLTENGVISFDFKRDAEAADLGMFRLGSTEFWRTLGPGETTNTQRIFAGGSSSLTIRYQKDGSIDAGADAMWLDNLSVPYMVSTGGAPISSAFSGSGTLTTAWSNFVNIASAFTGAGSLSTALTNYKRISSAYTGSGSLSTALTNYQRINSSFTGSGALSTHLTFFIHSNLSGSGTLTTAVSTVRHIDSAFTGAGVLATALHRYVRSALSGTGVLSTVVGTGTPSGYTTAVYFSSEGVLLTELSYTVKPLPLDAAPLGKLVSFNVGNSAVPLNPSEGSGAVPTVNATYIAGTDVEFVLGENNVLKNDSIGTYEGEIVSLDTGRGSDEAALNTSTPLTLLNLDMHLFPFIDASASSWTAARAIDYWTQQCGLFYDKVPGNCVAYASAYGHTSAYGAGVTDHFYEKRTGGSTSTTVLNGRSVKSFGSAVTGTTAFHEAPKASVPVSLSGSELLVFSIGLGVRGTGRTASVTWNFVDSIEAAHTLQISATSAGHITAKVDGVTIDSADVAGSANYRLTAALERVSETTLGGRLTVHTDDLNGALTEAYSGPAVAVSAPLQDVLQLKSITHASSGGSGAEMLRWGTYLTIAKSHPRQLPVLKSLAQTAHSRQFVSGFEGNVWSLLNEFCSLNRLDIQYLDNQFTTVQRISTLSEPRGNFSTFNRSASRRDKYKQVAVVNRQSKAVTSDDAIFWRADSVYQVAAREVFETTVQTDHSILSLVQPTAVTGIWPFPYTQGSGQYVVTGADGYIVSPTWWADNGGKLEVSLTGKEGEIAIKITAPPIDTVRAPYRISEGEGDRPALYIAGSGILNDPIEVHVGTGALNAKEGFDSVYESPFIATIAETYDAAIAMAEEYSASVAEIDFEIPNSFGETTRFGQFPAGALFTDNVSNYRITGSNQTHSKVTGTAVPFTTVGAYVDSFPEGATIADEMARHAGRVLKQVAIKPLRGVIETA